jgi:ferredoxin
MGQTTDNSPVVIDVSGLDRLIEAIHAAGYKVIGPTVRDHAIVYDEVRSTADLPRGWTDEQAPGRYRLERRGDDALFGYNVGPHTWKQHLFPASEKVWQLTIRGECFETQGTTPPEQPMAFLGVRACELAAMQIQDRVFIEQDYLNAGYATRRESSLVIAVNCGEAGGTCFCDSMDTGPRAETGFDLSLTELMGETGHTFLVEIGTPRGKELIDSTTHRPARDKDREDADQATENARQQMGRSLQTDGLPDLIARNLEHPIWDEIAGRCLSCANCTLVCPTCFCSSFEDTSDLSGEIAERWRQWDSCFNGEFSYVHGGQVRQSTGSRYRQWMSHKLSTWHDQFGTSGCVGCGRCITWCPTGIDLTAEAAAIRQRDGEAIK